MSTLIEPDWPAPANVRAVSSTRVGGGSRGPYASLNLGLHVGDAAHTVAENRRRFVAAGRLPDEPVWLEQVHGIEVVQLRRDASASTQVPRADAAWTSEPGVVCCVMTADCLPILLCDAAGTRVGVAHAGWRGLLGGVVEAAVAALGSASLLAWLGPAISQAAYEVGGEVREAFVAQDEAAAAAFAPGAPGRWQADLYTLARQALSRCGVTGVSGGGYCTFTEQRRFFSHRREAPCGRMATVIWLERAG